MRWDKYSNNIIRTHWMFCSDKVLAVKLGVTKDAVGAQRKALGIYRFPPDGFVVQVTKWLPKISDLDCAVGLMRGGDIEYIISDLGGKYSLFRKYAGMMNVVDEPPEDTWVDRWVPLE